MSLNKKLDQKTAKKSAFLTPFNKTKQQFEPVIFPNGIVIDLTSDGFRRGLQVEPGNAPLVTTNTIYNENGTLKFDGTTIGGPGTAAPNTPEYLITDSVVPGDIPNARVFTAGSNISLVESTGVLTISSTASGGGGSGGGGDPDASYLVLSTTGSLSAERVLTAGDGIDTTDAGAGGNFTIDVDVTDVIDTSYGLTESSNNIQVNLYTNGGLSFDGGAIKVNVADGVTVDGSGNVVFDAQDENVVLSNGVYAG